MIDTAILLVGFVCAGLVFSLCAIEYSVSIHQYSLVTDFRKILPRGPKLHSFVMGIVAACVILASLLSFQ